MQGATFPFEVVDGRVKSVTGLAALKEIVKRTIHYSTKDLPYDVELGSGIDDAVFAPDMSKGLQTFLKSTISNAILDIDGISRVNVQPRKTEDGQIEVQVFYFVDGETEMQDYTYNSN